MSIPVSRASIYLSHLDNRYLYQRKFSVILGFHNPLPTGSRPPSSRRNLSVARANPIIKTRQAVEEETLPVYDPDEFYPVHIGDVFKERYHVLGKLGFGANSTTWFCRDLR